MAFKALPKIPEYRLDKATHLGKANIVTTNKWIRTIHNHGKLRTVMRDKVSIKNIFNPKGASR